MGSRLCFSSFDALRKICAFGRKEQVNFLLVPEPSYPHLMNLWTKLRVGGTIMAPKVRPDTVSLLTKGAKALSALAVGPLGLLAPFVHLGANKNHSCDVPSLSNTQGSGIFPKLW